MTTTNKEAKEFWDMLDKLKKEADEETEYQGGKAYYKFLELFYKAKQDESKKK